MSFCAFFSSLRVFCIHAIAFAAFVAFSFFSVADS